jgi:hypothetical protein
MRYRCCFLNEDGQVVKVEELNSSDDLEVQAKLCGLDPAEELAYRYFCATIPGIAGRTRSGTLGSPNWRGGSTPLAAPAHVPLPPISPGR